MSWSPISVNDQRPSHHTFLTDSGIFSLVGVANNQIALHLIQGSTLRVCIGTWTITNAAGGLADFYPSALDVGTAGDFIAYPVVTLSTGPVAMDSQVLEIQNRT